MSDKKRRQAAILNIISQREVETQKELQDLLEQQGFKATQATVSRDIAELRIDKGNSENGINCYYSPNTGNAAEYNSIFAQAVKSIDYAVNTVVIKCRAGLANAACAVLDEQNFDCIVGTIAGDDTVFVLTRTELHAVQLIRLLEKMRKR